tara:strand:+ start:676 stop:870 length:195 start_codon:yes stop_codon:yes gene_type:complete
MQSVYEEIFFLIQNGNWNFSEAYTLPLGLRRWFVSRLLKHLKDVNQPAENNNKMTKLPRGGHNF